MKSRAILSLALAMLVFSPVQGVATMSPVDAVPPYHGPPLPSDIQAGINTTYRYEFLYNLTRLNAGSPGDDERWIPVLGNRTSLSLDGTVHQQEFIPISETMGPVDAFQDVIDDKDNRYYYVQVNPSIGSSWVLHVVGNLTIRETSWLASPSIAHSEYNVSDGLYLRYTAEEEYINKSHPLIHGNASLLNATSVFQTAKDVYQFVSEFLDYELQSTENGAEWAIENGRGDCTEFSYLMVAMLRACGIPARVLRGTVIASSSLQGVRPDFRAPVGSGLELRATFENGIRTFDNMTGHAWVEYFIPGFGWITADPTWANAGDYASRIDNVHVPYTNGVWIGDGILPALPVPGGVTEKLSTLPFPIYVANGFKHDIRYSFTVVNQEFPKTWADLFLDFIMQNPVLVAGIALVAIAVIIVALLVKVRRANSDERAYRKKVTFSEY